MKKNNYSGKELFVKSMVYTAAALALFLIGYVSAGYFFG